MKLSGSRKFAALLLMLASVCTAALATTTAVPPEIYIGVSRADGFSGPTHKAIANSLPYEFGASIEWRGGYLPKGDVYFGLIYPGGQTAATWAERDGTLDLQRGLTPIKTGIDLVQPTTINLYTQGDVIKHAFTPNDAAGMYLVFVVLVHEGASPADPQHWLGVEMTPLFVQPSP